MRTDATRQANVDSRGMAGFYQLEPRHQFDRTDAVIFLKLETETNGNIPDTPTGNGPVSKVQLCADGKREPHAARIIRRSKLWQ